MNSCSRAEKEVDISRKLQHNFCNGKKIEKDHSMIETCGLKNIFLQTIISFVLSRKIIKSIKVTWFVNVQVLFKFKSSNSNNDSKLN